MLQPLAQLQSCRSSLESSLQRRTVGRPRPRYRQLYKDLCLQTCDTERLLTSLGLHACSGIPADLMDQFVARLRVIKLPSSVMLGARQGSSTVSGPVQAAELARDALQRELMMLQPSLHHADLAQQAEEAVASVSSSHHAAG